MPEETKIKKVTPSKDKVMKDEEIMKLGKEIGKIKIERKSGNLTMTVQVHPLVEDLLKTEETESSSVYKLDKKKLMYYKLKVDNGIQPFAKELGATVNNYGTDLIHRGFWNFSIIRTVGISNGITVGIDGLISTDNLEKYAVKFKRFIAKLFREYIKEVEISTSVTMKNV